MATITCLPDEIITIIFGYNNTSIEDIINFRCTCKQFRWAVNKSDKYFWEKKKILRWPSAKKVYDEQFKKYKQVSKENERKDNKIFIKTGINCARELQSYVFEIIREPYYDESIDKYNNKSIDNLMQFEEVFFLDGHLKIILNEIISKPENFIKYSFFIDEIRNLLTQSPRTNCDLTERYCNIKLFHYMRQCSVKEKWYRFRRQSHKNQLLERKATMVAQWFQPEKDVFYSCVKASLNSIAVEVRNCLREKHPDHSIFLTSDETFSYWESNNIDDNHWNEAEGMQIMDTLDECMFDKLNFRPSKSEDITNLEYMCIDNVLKNKYGQEIIILIIYHSVARRLGLRCDVIKLPRHYRFCIFWKPRYATRNLENIRCFTLSEIVEKFPDCLVNKVSHFKALYSERSFLGDFLITANNKMYEIREILESLMIFRENPILLNPREYRIRRPKLILRFIKGALVVPRSEDVKFAVGMIVTHRHHDQSTESCTGVIIGWHRYIDRHVEFFIEKVWDWAVMDKGLLPLNHCRNYNFRMEQTNYIILTDKNDMCYVEEDIITLTTPKWIDNSEIGRYFCKFEDTHYVPNKMLASLYPQDAAITAQTTINY